MAESNHISVTAGTPYELADLRAELKAKDAEIETLRSDLNHWYCVECDPDKDSDKISLRKRAEAAEAALRERGSELTKALAEVDVVRVEYMAVEKRQLETIQQQRAQLSEKDARIAELEREGVKGRGRWSDVRLLP